MNPKAPSCLVTETNGDESMCKIVGTDNGRSTSIAFALLAENDV